MKPKALIVDDDERIISSVEETLVSLGHELDSATNQLDAQRLLEQNDYSYVLLDLQIPTQPNRGGADKEFGCNLLRNIQKIKGPGRLPVIVMTGYSAECLDLSAELFAIGASEFIAKPFANKSRTLAAVIRKVLEIRVAPNMKSNLPTQFHGATMTFFIDRVEIGGKVICTKYPFATRWLILNALRKHNFNGTYISLTGQELANAAQIKESSISGAIRGLRKNISQALLSQNIQSDGADVICNRGAGYQIGERVVVVDSSDVGTIEGIVPDVRNRTVRIVPDSLVHDVPNPSVHNVHDQGGHNSKVDGLCGGNDDVRAQWILQQLEMGHRLKGPDVVAKFGCSSKTAFRLLKCLRESGRIKFVGSARVGFYQRS
jgi:CheY-like chemotaxis protein